MLTLILSTKIQNCLNFKFEPTQILIDTKERRDLYAQKLLRMKKNFSGC